MGFRVHGFMGSWVHGFISLGVPAFIRVWVYGYGLRVEGLRIGS